MEGRSWEEHSSDTNKYRLSCAALPPVRSDRVLGQGRVFQFTRLVPVVLAGPPQPVFVGYLYFYLCFQRCRWSLQDIIAHFTRDPPRFWALASDLSGASGKICADYSGFSVRSLNYNKANSGGCGRECVCYWGGIGRKQYKKVNYKALDCILTPVSPKWNSCSSCSETTNVTASWWEKNGKCCSQRIRNASPPMTSS